MPIERAKWVFWPFRFISKSKRLQSTHRRVLGGPRGLPDHAPGELGNALPCLHLTGSREPRLSQCTAVERDKDATAIVQKLLKAPEHRCIVGLAEKTELPDASASVVYGEAMLWMQTPEQKFRIIREANRLLKPDGRYGIHELCLIPNDLDESTKSAIHNDLSAAIHHGTRPLTIAEWQRLLESEGFSVQTQAQAPMHLLEPGRVIQDEGMFGALRFDINLLCNRDARRRVLAIRRVFSKHRDHLAAVMFVGTKDEEVAQ